MLYFRQKIKIPADVKESKKQYFLMYTVFFLFTALILFSWSFLSGRTLIYGGDGWHQHYRALVYYGAYLRSIVKELLFHHRLVIPAWDFAIGEGSDILRTMHYYVIGDPFAAGSVLIPMRFMYVYYDAMLLLRMYLSGIAFSCLCFHTGLKNGHGILAGSITYVFSYWAIYAARHPFFLNPMLYLPLLILGIEKILKKERPYLFIFAVFFSAVSNFYFFYILVWITVLYVAIRLPYRYRRDFKAALQIFLKIGGASVFGVLLSAVIFLPMFPAFLGSSRRTAENAIHLFYPFSYYLKFPSLFMTWEQVPYWTCIGLSAPAAAAILLLFYKRNDKKSGFLKLLFTACLVLFAFPVFGHICNAFSYKANRWSFAFALLCAYILAAVWPALMKLKRREKSFLLWSLSCFFAVCLAAEYIQNLLGDSAMTANIFSSIILAFLFLCLLMFQTDGDCIAKQQKKQWIGILVVIASLCNNCFWQNMAGDGNSAFTHKTAASVPDLAVNETQTVKDAAYKEGIQEFYRFSGENLTTNANINADLSSTQFYWSLANPNTLAFREDLELMESKPHVYTGYDGRTGLLALSSVRYYALPVNAEHVVPYGFTLADTNVDRGYQIYQNNYALPLSYTYDNYMPKNLWDKLPAVEKQEAMLQTCVLENETDGIPQGSPHHTSKDIAYKLTCKGDGVLLKGHTFVVTSPNAEMKLKFSGIADSENYLSIQGLNYEGTKKFDLYFGGKKADPSDRYTKSDWDGLSEEEKRALLQKKILKETPKTADISFQLSTGLSRTITYDTPEVTSYNNRHDFTINLGYSQKAAKSMTIKFKDIGIYSFDSIHVICQPMKTYKEQIKARNTDTLRNVKMETNTITGNISLDKPKLLCLSIPYSEGWHISVDGRETELLRANIQYTAVALNAGEHEIKLVYATPLLKEGICISAASFLIFAVFIFLLERRRNN